MKIKKSNIKKLIKSTFSNLRNKFCETCKKKFNIYIYIINEEKEIQPPPTKNKKKKERKINEE